MYSSSLSIHSSAFDDVSPSGVPLHDTLLPRGSGRAERSRWERPHLQDFWLWSSRRHLPAGLQAAGARAQAAREMGQSRDQHDGQMQHPEWCVSDRLTHTVSNPQSFKTIIKIIFFFFLMKIYCYTCPKKFTSNFVTSLSSLIIWFLLEECYFSLQKSLVYKSVPPHFETRRVYRSSLSITFKGEVLVVQNFR